MQLARLISSQCKGQMVNHWSPDQLQVTWPPSVLMYFFSSWTVFVTIYPMQFLSWLDNIALWHFIFSPSDLHQEGWCPTDHLISTSAKPLGHTQFFQKYFLQFSKCISQYQPNAFPSDSLARPIIHLIGWFPPGEQHLIVQSWQISADHVCLSSRLQIEFLSFYEISNTF